MNRALIAALVTAAALIAPAAASAQAPTPAVPAASIQNEAASLQAAAKTLTANIAARNDQIKLLTAQIKGLAPLVSKPGVLAAITSLQMRINQLTAENQRDMERLQVLQRRLADLYAMTSAMMQTMADQQSAIIKNIRG